MTRDQKVVAIGAASGVAGMAALVWAISNLWPHPEIADNNGDRIAYALRWSVVAVLPLFCMIAAVGNARFASEAIDPTQGKEDHKMVVDGRVADNTTQQFLLYLIGITALSVSVPIHWMSIVPAIAITFFLCRIVFWVGYRIHPLYRAPGFSSTAYMNGFMFIAVLVLRIAG